MTKHKDFEFLNRSRVDKRGFLKILSICHTLEDLYEDMNFAACTNIIYLTAVSHQLRRVRKRTLYLPFIIEDIKINIGEI